jgi:hypothetical protein
MKNTVPLCYTRIWCRNNQAWLSFKTNKAERFLVSAEGYFIELPDGSITRISPRTTFPFVNKMPSIVIDNLLAREQFGKEALFLSVPMRHGERQTPVMVPVDEIRRDPLHEIKSETDLEPLEKYLLHRMLENGVLTMDAIPGIVKQRDEKKKSVGEILISNNNCHWETLLAQCLDIRPPSRLDPPSLRSIIERREWELTGEILVWLDKINRTELEHALKVKRDATQALGQILTAMGACSEKDVEHCLQLQAHLKQANNDGIVLIGKLLVTQGIITEDDLEEILWKQKVSRQPLESILIAINACSKKDIEAYVGTQGGNMQFQQAVDEAAMANHLVKSGKITKLQLDEALRIQQRGRQVLGEMMVAYGLCNAEDIADMVALQREVREAYRSGVERLGDLLIKRGKVPGHMVEDALETQSIGRQPFGAILVATGACLAADINLALEIQQKWRARPKEPGDRLGEVLVKASIISPKQLADPLLQHMREEKPLGRILVENGICKPEAIIGALIDRDSMRQEQFLSFVSSHRPDPPPAVDKEVEPVMPSTTQPDDQNVFVNKVSAVFKQRHKERK